MVSTPGCRKLFGEFQVLLGVATEDNTAISDLDLIKCPKSGVSYRKLPKEFLPPRCSGRRPFHDALLNDDWVCFASGREDFLHMKRTQHELGLRPLSHFF